MQVEDYSTARLSVDFYQKLASLPQKANTAQALQTAQLNLFIGHFIVLVENWQ